MLPFVNSKAYRKYTQSHTRIQL